MGAKFAPRTFVSSFQGPAQLLYSVSSDYYRDMRVERNPSRHLSLNAQMEPNEVLVQHEHIHTHVPNLVVLCSVLIYDRPGVYLVAYSYFLISECLLGRGDCRNSRQPKFQRVDGHTKSFPSSDGVLYMLGERDMKLMLT